MTALVEVLIGDWYGEREAPFREFLSVVEPHSALHDEFHKRWPSTDTRPRASPSYRRDPF